MLIYCHITTISYYITVKPKIEISKEQNAVFVEVSDPPLFQRKSEFYANDIHLKERFRVRCSRFGDDKNRYENISHTQRRFKLPGLSADTKYEVVCEMDCNSRDILSCEKEFTSQASCKMINYRA